MTKPLHERLRDTIGNVPFRDVHEPLLAEVAALETAARTLVDALQPCDNCMGAAAAVEHFDCWDNTEGYFCDDCSKDRRAPWGQHDMPHAPQLRKLLEVLK